MTIIGRWVSVPRASPKAPAGASPPGAGTALGCGATVGAGWPLLATVGASVGAAIGAGVLVGCSSGRETAGAAVGAEAVGCPPQAANAITPPSSGASRRNGFGESIMAPLWCATQVVGPAYCTIKPAYFGA